MVTLQISCLRFGVYTILVLKFFRPPWDSKVKTPVYNATDSIDLVYRYPLSIFAICASKSFLTHGLIAHCIVLYNRRCMSTFSSFSAQCAIGWLNSFLFYHFVPLLILHGAFFRNCKFLLASQRFELFIGSFPLLEFSLRRRRKPIFLKKIQQAHKLMGAKPLFQLCQESTNKM